MVPERPDTEVTAKPARRRFTAEYKCGSSPRPGSARSGARIGRLLEREGLSALRRCRLGGSRQGRERGPKPRPAEEKRWSEEVWRLQWETTGLRRRLLEADAVAERQAKRCGSADRFTVVPARCQGGTEVVLLRWIVRGRC